MKNTINKIFSGEVDQEVHYEFLKFSKGLFENRYLIESKKQKDKWSVKTSAEFANYFVKRCIPNKGKIDIKGIIATTLDLKKDISFSLEKIKQFAGVKQYMIETQVDSAEIINLMNKYPKAFFALSFLFPGGELKIKAKSPKSGKPGKKGEEGEPKADFCSVKTSDRSLVDDLFFDKKDFNEIRIKHSIQINEIDVPKNIQDPKELREKSKRKGVIKRIIVADGTNEIKERPFFV